MQAFLVGAHPNRRNAAGVTITLNSVEDTRPPTIITETGYKSSFPGLSGLNISGINAKAAVRAVIKIGFTLSKVPRFIMCYPKVSPSDSIKWM